MLTQKSYYPMALKDQNQFSKSDVSTYDTNSPNFAPRVSLGHCNANCGSLENISKFYNAFVFIYTFYMSCTEFYCVHALRSHTQNAISGN